LVDESKLRTAQRLVSRIMERDRPEQLWQPRASTRLCATRRRAVGGAARRTTAVQGLARQCIHRVHRSTDTPPDDHVPHDRIEPMTPSDQSCLGRHDEFALVLLASPPHISRCIHFDLHSRFDVVSLAVVPVPLRAQHRNESHREHQDNDECCYEPSRQAATEDETSGKVQRVRRRRSAPRDG
jgi:hypothetical protein